MFYIFFDIHNTGIRVLHRWSIYLFVRACVRVCMCQFDEGRADLKLAEDQKWFKGNITSFIGENSLELITPFSQEVNSNYPTNTNNNTHTHAHLFAVSF